jgi:hypothetical protein
MIECAEKNYSAGDFRARARHEIEQRMNRREVPTVANVLAGCGVKDYSKQLAAQLVLPERLKLMTKHVHVWFVGHPDVQRWVRDQPERGLRADALRTMARNGPEQLPGVDLYDSNAVDWQGIVDDVLG